MSAWKARLEYENAVLDKEFDETIDDYILDQLYMNYIYAAHRQEG